MCATPMLATIALLLAGAAPAFAAAPVFTLGSYVGLDVYSQEGTSFTLFSTSPTNRFLFLPEPGLRLGLYLPDQRLEVAALVGTTVVMSSYESLGSFGTTLECNYFFGDQASGVSPYVGVHGGAAMAAAAGDFEVVTNLGAQLGVRRVVAGDHGAVRLEARGGIVSGVCRSMTDLGVRVGYDLWLR